MSDSGWLFPRWLKGGLLLAALCAVTFLVAEVSGNWTIAPTAVFLGSMAGPFALAIWITDRTRVGRSVPSDVLFTTFLVGGGVAILFTGFFESAFFYPAAGRGYLWIGLVEETSKVITALVICTAVPKYRSVEQALAFAIVTAGGFAAFESMTYALYALDDDSARAARRVLLERTFITPFGHLPWTCIAVVVAATAWQAAHRILLTPRALWGLAAAIVLHTSWNFVLVEGGWWSLVVPIVAAATFLLFRRVIAGVYYDGPTALAAEHYRPGRQGTGADHPPI